MIGEDLGTVPVEIVSKLRDSGVYSYKVLYFENDHEKTFRAPQAYPEQSMAVATTHDLPTLRGYWESGDLTLGKTRVSIRMKMSFAACIRIASWRSRVCWMHCISTAVCRNAPGIKRR